MDPEIATLLGQFVGVVTGAIIGAYLYGHFSEKGRINAVKKALADVLDQERGKAYAAEKGKRAATHEDIENVRSEVQVLTNTAETIKSSISGELWRTQRVWDEKRLVYADLLRIATRMKIQQAELRHWYIDQEAGNRKSSDLETLRGQVARHDQKAKLHADMLSSLEEFVRATALARMFATPECVSILERYERFIEHAPDEDTPESMDREIEELIIRSDNLTRVAKADLGPAPKRSF